MTDKINTTGDVTNSDAEFNPDGEAMGIDGKVRDLMQDLQEKGAIEHPRAGCAGRHWKSWPSHVPSRAVEAWIRADGKGSADMSSPDMMNVKATILMTPTKGHGDWAPDRVLLLDGDKTVRALPAKHQLVTDAWRILTMPRLVFMPEKKRLLLFARRELPYNQYEPDGVVLLSDDMGETWSDPVIVPRGICTVGYLGNGNLILGGCRSSANGFELLQWRSEDYGATWTAGTAPGVSNGGGFWQWGDYLVDLDTAGNARRIVAPGYTEKKDGSWPNSCCMLRISHDGGATWPEEIIPPSWNGGSGVGVSEVTLCRGADGTIVAGCRIAKKEFASLIDFYSGMGVSLSKDDGKTWSEIKLLHDYGRHHSSMVCLPSGEMVMAYVDRLGGLDEKRRVLDADGFMQWSVEAIVSKDNGETWDTKRRYCLAKWSGMSSVQDTTTVQLDDGSLVTGFGGTYRSEQVRDIKGPTIDVGLVRWQLDEA